jgi:urocanate hydratase
MRNAIDKGLSKVISRKLLVWLSATGLALYGLIDSGDWVILSGIYIGSQGVIDSIARLKGVK